MNIHSNGVKSETQLAVLSLSTNPLLLGQIQPTRHFGIQKHGSFRIITS